MAEKYPCPEGIGGSGADLWRDVTGAYTLRPDELQVLESACRERALIDRLEEELSDADLIVKGSQGQPVANPLVSEVRQHRAVLARLLGQLRLPDAPGGESGSSSRSDAARRAAVARWSA